MSDTHTTPTHPATPHAAVPTPVPARPSAPPVVKHRPVPEIEAQIAALQVELDAARAHRDFVPYPKWVKKVLIPAKPATATTLAVPEVIEGPVLVDSEAAWKKLGAGWV